MVAQKVKNLPVVQETWVRKDPWVRKMPWRRECIATHSCILAWKIPWMEEPGRYSPWGRRVGQD